MKMYLLFSHKLTEEQIKDAKINLGVREFIYLPENLQKIWSGIPPEIDCVSDYIRPIKEFLAQTSEKGDFVLIQGEFGAVVDMVKYCKKNGLIPVYSTTKRVSYEEKQGDKVIKKSVFNHVRFRRYC